MPEFGDADQTIKIRFSEENQGEAVKKLNEIISLLKQFPDISSKVKTASKQSTDSQVQGLTKTKAAVDTTKKSYNELAQILHSTGSLGSILATALTGTVGVILALVSAMKLLVEQLKQAYQYGYEFAKAVYQLQIGINAIRRAGVEITLQDVYENLDRLQAKFGIFSRKELVEGSAALINLTRDFGLTKEEIFSLQDAIATLAVVNGRAMDDVQRTVALAISSGYTEGLQRLGVSINRVTIALEAERLGFGRNYMSLTEQQRAQATYNLILEKTSKYQDDLEEYQNSAPGQIDAMKASWKDLWTEIGENIIPAFGALASILDTILERLVSFNQYIQESKLPEWIINLSKYAPWLVGGASLAWAKSMQAKAEEPEVTDEEKQKQLNERLNEAASALWEKTLEIQDEYTEKLNDNYEDYLQDREDLLISYNQKAEDIERNFAQKLEDIEINVSQKNSDAWTSYYQQLEDINTWYNQAVEDANSDHQQKLLEAEEDFQDEMRKLRQQFLFDLEDAIRERDAKQAMLLIRQYNFDKQQAQQNQEDNQEEINDDYQQELQDLRKQKARKLAEARDELNRRFAEIQREYIRELEELGIWKQREYEERELWYQRELEQTEINLQRKNESAAKARDDALRDLIKDFNKEYELTNEHWLAIFKLTDAYIGNNGALTQLVRNFAEFYAAALANISSSSILDPTKLSPMQQVNWGGSYANGGQVTVSKPTLALFGERGTETATFTPASKSGGANGKVAIEVLLSPDLEARIVDNTLGEVADMVIAVEKMK